MRVDRVKQVLHQSQATLDYTKARIMSGDVKRRDSKIEVTRLYEPISPRLKHDKFTVRMKKEFLSNRNVVSQDFGEG